MAKTKVISKAKTFDGWELKEWFLGNWKTIKEIAKVGAPLLVASLATSNPALLGFLTIVGKFLLDAGEYWYKEISK